MTTNESDAVAAAEHALYAAMVAPDYAALDGLLSEALSYVHSTGVAESKAEYFAGLREGLYEYQAIETLERSLHMLGSAALSAGVIDMRVGAKGAAKDTIRLRHALLWVSEGGSWHLLLRQATRIPRTAGRGV